MRFERQFVVLAGSLSCAVLLTASGCADGSSPGGERVVARTTIVAGVLPSHGTGASIEERFGLPPSPGSTGDGVDEAAGLLRWDLPKGWVERAPSSMRLANFFAAGNPDAECYLTILAGDAGGLGANVNRWLAQMGQVALGPERLDALPHAKLFGRDAVLLETEGEFTGMGVTSAKSEQRLLGLLLVDPNGSAFFKLVGPSAVVESERTAFLRLAESLRSATQPPATAATDDSDAVAGVHRERAAGLVARVPNAWTRMPSKPPRALELRVDAQTECSITVLPGQGGGARPNIDRWRSQLGLQPLDDTQFLGLERIPLLGGSALLVEASMANRAVLGAVHVTAERSVFVKLTGPVGQIARHRAEFLDLCGSLGDG